VKLVIFDCDGVLVDTETITGKFLYDYIKSQGTKITEEETISRFSGQNLSCAIKDIEELTKKKAPVNFIATFRQDTMKKFEPELKVIPGIEDALKKIPTKKCVASNGPMNKMQLTLKSTGLDKFFLDALFSAYDIQKWKPDPGLFLHAAKTMGSAPQNCIVIEDSIHGVKAALAANMQVLGFESRENDSIFLGSLKELQVPSFSSMSELPKLIQNFTEQ
jgi:HAD superfamily hydrolase (TIGR01509 family)